MKILYATSEAQPFAASGGLADVAGSLPKALVAEGQECIVVLPYYINTIKDSHKENIRYVDHFYVSVGWRAQYCGVFETELNGVTYYFLDNEYYFKRDFGLYGYYDDGERYAFFSRAVMELIQKFDLRPDVINANDWQCALIPVYYNLYYRNQYNMQNIHTVFTIHNIQYQGRYGLELMEEVLGIPKHYKNIMEYDGDVNFMKAAIEVSEKVTTVSPTYATEILDPWFSHGLDRILKNKTYKTCGFLNGIDTDMYNPEKDPAIPATFSAKSKSGKRVCKKKLLEEVGLPTEDGAPVIGLVSRLVEHKGLDLIKCAFDEMITLGCKIVILGSGEAQYENFFNEMHYRYPDKVSFTCGYIPALAKKIYAGADMFLMPSKSEPCGLAQMISLRYGTIPVVRATGGLKDSIPDYGEPDGKGLGFTFLSYNALDMLGAVRRCTELYYNDSKAWGALVTKAMKADFSWAQSAKLYIGLYQEICGMQ